MLWCGKTECGKLKAATSRARWDDSDATAVCEHFSYLIFFVW